MTTAIKPSGQPKGKLYIWSRGGSRVYAGRPIAMGQAIELAGVQNDAKLIDLGFLKPVRRGTKLEQCLRCGAWFGTEAQLHDHQDECGEAEGDLPDLEVGQEVDE